MLGELTPTEIERVLRENVVGRIGCHASGQTYVVPVTYAYDGVDVYSHSRDGLKLRMMRENPHVCFEVDHMDGQANWSSVIAQGTFVELHGSEREQAKRVLLSTMESRLPLGPPGESVHPHDGMIAATVYRIVLANKTGRFERRS